MTTPCHFPRCECPPTTTNPRGEPACTHHDRTLVATNGALDAEPGDQDR